MRLAVCSWSLAPATPAALVDALGRTGLRAVQLALDPIREGAWDLAETRETLAAAEVSILSGMMKMAGEDYSTLETIRVSGGVRPDEQWEANRAAAEENARIAAALELPLVTFHAGFIPHDDEALRETMVERLRTLADIFAAAGVKVAFETGQETAETLLDALRELDRPEVGVNFDPANMILYGMGDPIDAVRRLAPRIAQVHVKDAKPSAVAGEWGTEVVAGSGVVDWNRFLGIVANLERSVDLIIEREAGDERALDIRTAHALVRQTLDDLGEELTP